MPLSHLILCRPLLLLPPIPPSIRVFSNESTLCMRWPKYWGFSLSISPSNEHPGLISIRMDWLDLLAVQGTCKSLLQHHSSKASILQHSAFFTVQLSHPCMTTGKTIALTRQTFVSKVISLLFSMLSRLSHCLFFHGTPPDSVQSVCGYLILLFDSQNNRTLKKSMEYDPESYHHAELKYLTHFILTSAFHFHIYLYFKQMSL